MSRLQCILTSSILAVLASVALAAPAQATAVKVTCAVDGLAKFDDKALPPPYGIYLVGGKGFYTLTGFVTCTGISKGQPTAATLQISSTGTYANLICGTGKMQNSTFDVLSSSDGQTAKWDATLSDEKYAVEIADFAGTWYWHDSDKNLPDTKISLLDADKDGNFDEKDYDLAGTLSLQPPLSKIGPPPGALPNYCTKALRLIGTIVIDEN